MLSSSAGTCCCTLLPITPLPPHSAHAALLTRSMRKAPATLSAPVVATPAADVRGRAVISASRSADVRVLQLRLLAPLQPSTPSPSALMLPPTTTELPFVWPALKSAAAAVMVEASLERWPFPCSWCCPVAVV